MTWAEELASHRKKAVAGLVNKGWRPDDAEDLVQDCIIEAMQNPSIKRGAGPWLYGLISMRKVDWVRKRKHQELSLDGMKMRPEDNRHLANVPHYEVYEPHRVEPYADDTRYGVIELLNSLDGIPECVLVDAERHLEGLQRKDTDSGDHPLVRLRIYRARATNKSMLALKAAL